ncbi:asparaginase [Oceanobacter kriegii]|uniref:asparaginase n=1 Tax=Oceanobacter kriegii TaxID=64972 RepID=UPI00040776C9|nr:asparaginase [Oceanobacter kriegii]
MNNTKRILVIYTGGTIGMVPSDQGYVPAPGFEARVRKHLNDDIVQQLPEFEVLEMDQLIDSSNAVPADWARVATLLQQHWQQYDGFVVLHGTDTMAYTAAALSFMITPMDKPVIVTGSQIPLGVIRSDAVDNLTNSLLFATSNELFEVCICFGNRLLRGNRASKLKTTALDTFDSPNFEHLGKMQIDVELYGDLLLRGDKADFCIPEFSNSSVKLLMLYPGITADMIEAPLKAADTRAVIMISYGVGNPPDANPTLIPALEDAISRGIAVVNLSHCLWGDIEQGAYSTGATLNRIGVIGGRDITLEAAFAKLHWLTSMGFDQNGISAGFTTPKAGEIKA